MAQLPAEAIAIHVDALLARPKDALLPICICIPGWQGAHPDDIGVQQLSGAMTNLVYKVDWHPPNTEGTRLAIIRVFGGTDGLFDRDSERSIFRLMSEMSLGPTLLFEFTNGRVEEFWPGHSIDAQSMQHTWVASSVATALANFHWHGPALAEEGQQGTLWGRLQDWLALVRELWEVAEGKERWSIDSLEHTMQQLHRVLQGGMPPWYAFCHNDLQYGNMMLFYRPVSSGTLSPAAAGTLVGRKRGTSELRRNSSLASLGSMDRASLVPTVRFIDYEYACFNHIGFDIANHWCEYAADYHTDSPHLLHFERIPDQAAQRVFTHAYVHKLVRLWRTQRIKRVDSRALSADLEASLEASGSGFGKRDSTLSRAPSLAEIAHSSMAAMVQDCRDDDDIDALAVEVQKAAVAHIPLSHLHWGLWGLIQAKQSSVDFDFEAYAAQRLDQYMVTARDMLSEHHKQLPT